MNRLRNNAKAVLTTGGSKFIRTNALTMDAGTTLDLGDGSLIVQSSSANKASDFAKVNAAITSGRNGGAWDGVGIISSVAAAQPNKLTGLATILNDKGGGIPITSNLAGETVNANAILVKYSWNGDADLTGQIDADDYFQIDAGFAIHAQSYRNGDFDYNGIIDADDYFLIDRAFAGQTGILAATAPKSKPAAKHHKSHSAKHRH